MWAVGRKINGKWSFVARKGRTGILSKALLFAPNGDGFDMALDRRDLPGDHLVRVMLDGPIRLGVG